VNWNQQQLVPIVDRLRPHLEGRLTARAELAVAAVARSLVLEKKTTGNGVRYARGQNHYRVPERYRTGGPYYTFRYVTQSVDLLLGAGLIENAPGVWGQGAAGRQSVAWATECLVDLVGDLVEVDEQPGVGRRVETIVLRDAEKKTIDYADTPATLLMRAEVEDLNRHLSELRLYLDGQRQHIPVMRRVFNLSPDRGGRVYAAGDSYQNLPSERRLELRLDIDGKMHPTDEVDFATMHITMAYATANTPMPPGDQYAVGDFDRDLVKLAVNTIFNAATRNAAVNAIGDDIWTDEGLWLATGLSSLTRIACRNFASGLVNAIGDKHSQIKDYFHSDCGSRFQRRDSDIAIEVMQRMVRLTGRCPLPVHDSFVVADIDREVLVRVMGLVAYRHRLPLHLKGSDGSRWGPVLIPAVRSALPAPLHPPLSTWRYKPLICRCRSPSHGYVPRHG
jgi:hypothetical protein